MQKRITVLRESMQDLEAISTTQTSVEQETYLHLVLNVHTMNKRARCPSPLSAH